MHESPFSDFIIKIKNMYIELYRLLEQFSLSLFCMPKREVTKFKHTIWILLGKCIQYKARLKSIIHISLLPLLLIVI